MKNKLFDNFQVLEYDNPHITSLDSASNYIGGSYDGFLTLYKGYPNDILSEFNWEYFINWLKENGIEYDIVNYGHWAFGDYSRIGIRATNDYEKLLEVDEMLSSLSDYPIFDDTEYQQFEWYKFQEYFSREGFSEVCEKFFEITECNQDEISEDFIMELWCEFVFGCTWEYEVEQSYFILNLDEFEDYIINNFDYELYNSDKSLYYAMRNPNQLSMKLA